MFEEKYTTPSSGLRDPNIANRCQISYNPSLVVVYFYNNLVFVDTCKYLIFIKITRLLLKNNLQICRDQNNTFYGTEYLNTDCYIFIYLVLNIALILHMWTQDWSVQVYTSWFYSRKRINKNKNSKCI